MVKTALQHDCTELTKVKSCLAKVSYCIACNASENLWRAFNFTNVLRNSLHFVHNALPFSCRL